MGTALPRQPRIRRGLVAATVAAVALAAAVATILLGRGPALDHELAATYVPIPVYEIEAVSHGNEVTLLGLPLPYVGAPQIPIPVDINKDLLPDVTVAVNLINAQGIFNNPPNTGELIAPNIEFLRLLTAPTLNPIAFHDLRMNVKLTLIDLEGSAPDIVARFGYDTGHGGAIPPKYKAVVAGLENGFNPLEARIETDGGLLLGLDPRLPDLGLGPGAPAYVGPLTTYASIDSGPELQADVDIGFRPMPDRVGFTFASEADGTQAFTFAHNGGEVDLDITGGFATGDTAAEVAATIHRLPNAVALEILTADDRGGVQYASAGIGGRLADLSADIVLDNPQFDRPLRARVDAESLPESLGGTWSLAPGQPPELHFAGSGQGVGAIEARIQNYEGEPADFVPWVPDEQQHASIQAGPDGVLIGDTLIQARLERLRSASIVTDEQGAIEGRIEVGNGARPFQVHGELDLRPNEGPYINASATISPLPDVIDFVVTPTGDTLEEPMRILYAPSSTIDVDTEAFVALPDTEGPVAIGDPGTAYVDVALRNIPTRVEARLLNLESESRIEIDAVPRRGAAPLDVFANAVLGPVDIDGLPAIIDPLLAAPIYAELNVQGLPHYARVRVLNNPAQDLERVDVRTCDLDYDTNECAPGTNHAIAEVDFAVRNFDRDDRPENLPAPPQSGPQYLTVTARGLEDTNELVLYEATGRMTNFRQVTYLGTNSKDLTAAKVDVGGGADFRTWIDIEDVDIDGGDPADGRVSLHGDILVSPLPTPLTFCFAQNGRALTDEPVDAITAGCETDDPFGDDLAEQAPLIVHYEAPTPFDVFADIVLQGDLPFEQPELPVDFGTFDRIAAHLELTDIPSTFTAYVQTPAESAAAGTMAGTEAAATRILTVAPGASNTRLSLGAEITTPGVDCANPNPVGGAVCASVVVDQLPDYASVLAETQVVPGAATGGDDAVESMSAQFHACDFDFYGDDPDCRTPLTSIGLIEVSARAHAGDPRGVPTYLPPEDHPHVVAQAYIEDLANFEIEAGLRVKDLRRVVFHQGPDGLQASADLGDGIEPLILHGYADLRETDNLVPDDLRAEMVVDAVLDPLPQLIDFEMTGPGQAQSDPIHLALTTSSETLLTVDAEVREAGGGDHCGEMGTACASLSVDKVASHIAADIIRTFGPIVGNERDSRTQLFIHQDADDPVISASAAIGLPVLPESLTQVIGEGPVFADLVLTGVPQHISVDMQSHEVLRSNGSELEVRNSALEQFHFQTCRLDDDGACLTDPGDSIGLIEASVRTFDLRPTDFPAPPADHDPIYVGVAGRGNDLEAVVSIPEISEVQFLNRDGLLGARAQVGGTTPSIDRNMRIEIDIEDLRIADEISIGDLDIEEPRATVDVGVSITPFPGELEFCLRNAGLSPVPAPSGLGFTETCEDAEPFGAPLDYSPLSVGFHANTGFGVDVDADVSIDGTDAATGDPIDRHRFLGSLQLDDLPKDLIFHFLQPRDVAIATPDGIVTEPRGPFQARIETPGATSGIDVALNAAYLVGPDAICEDPRPGISATCIEATIRNLPTEVNFFYDPTLDLTDPAIDLDNPDDVTNFVLQTDGPATTDIEGLRFSTTSLSRLIDGSLPDPLKSDVLLATAELSGIQHPFDLRGTLDTPKEEGQAATADFAVQDGNTLPELTLHVRNFFSPDPTVGAFVPNRPVGTNTLDTYQISAILRGDAFVLDAELVGVREFGLRPVRMANRAPIGTTAINLDVAKDFNIRAFLDLEFEPGHRLLGDALIENLPAAVEVCVRGPREGAAKGQAAVNGTWCDSGEVRDGDGAIEVAMDHNIVGSELNIDAFARYQFGGGTSVIAGRVEVENLPSIVRVRYSGEDDDAEGGEAEPSEFEAGTFSRIGGGPAMPDGIDRITFEAATFDLPQASTGIVGPLPYTPFEKQTVLIPAQGGNPAEQLFPAEPAPADGREYLHAAADLRDSAFHVRGQIGRSDGAPSSQFQRVLYSSGPCDAPRNNPSDYPHMPKDDGTEYTCIKVDFDDPSPAPNPLSLHADALMSSGEALRLYDAGISDIPAWLQLQIADAEVYTDPENNRGWRRPCPPASSGDTGPCMAPLLRFDQPAESHLFGVVDFGRPSDLHHLNSVTASRPAPDFQATPDEFGWDGAFENDQGIRAMVVDFAGRNLPDASMDRIAARANLRLPIPRSLTVDQIQKYTSPEDAADEASDFRFHAAVRNSGGVVDAKIGEVAVLIHQALSGVQVILTDACETDVVEHDVLSLPDSCDRHLNGFSIPGQIGLTLYLRSHDEPFVDDGDDRIRSSTFIQVDGNVSTPLSLGARVVGQGSEVADGITLGNIEANIRNVPAADNPAHPYDPGFRLRAEVMTHSDAPKEFTGEPDENSRPGWVEFESEVDIGIQRAIVGFDFAPTGTPARRLDAVVTVDGAKLGADIAGFTTLDGTTPNAPVSIGFSAFVNPLDFFGKLVSNIGVNLEQVCSAFINEKWPSAPGWLKSAFSWLCGRIGNIVDFLFKALPITVELESMLGFQFTVDRLQQFTLRNNILRAAMEGSGPGSAVLGPVILSIDHLWAGMRTASFNIPVPRWLRILGVPPIRFPSFEILGYKYTRVPGPIQPPVLIDFRSCSGVKQVLPYSAGVNGIRLTPGSNDTAMRDFLIWPGQDPRLGISGILAEIILAPFGGTTGANGIVNFLIGPILCNAVFDVDADSFQAINIGAGVTDPNAYNPGNAATVSFDGHPVPGQPGQPDTLPEELPPPTTPVETGDPPQEYVPPAPPLAPGSPPPLYTGDEVTISANTAMCGVHEYNVLTVDAEVTVATTAGANCPAGQEGALELRANTLLVTDDGAIIADGISTDVPHFDAPDPGDPDPHIPTYPDYRATGNSGGTNAGAGFVGSYGASAPRPYGAEAGALDLYPGGPGADEDVLNPDVDADGDPNNGVHALVPSAGSAGLGGGVIVLRADNALVVNGTISADGTDGATNLAGDEDDDPDDTGTPGWDTFECDHDGDPDTPPIDEPNPRLDGEPGTEDRPCVGFDPGGPYEHTGFAGSGGGAGGGIALEARYQIDLSSGDVSARGGNGGGGRLGNGGGGGGGVVQVIAPIQVGVSDANLAAATTAGLNGTASLFPGVPEPSNPIDADDPGSELSTDGEYLRLQPPFARFVPNGPFWRAGGPGAPAGSFDGYFIGGGGPGAVTLHVCAVRLPTSAGPAQAGTLGAAMNELLPNEEVGTLPTAANPCGSRPGTDIVSVTTAPSPKTFSGMVTTPETVGLRINTSGYYGLYTTAVRGSHVEPLAGVEWVVGVDADRPEVEILSPQTGDAFDVGAAQLTFTTSDQAGLSGFDVATCRSYTFGAPPAADEEWYQCTSGKSIPLLSPDGLKVLEVRGYDKAGNVSTTKQVFVWLDTNAPTATLTLVGGVQQSDWYREAPSLFLSNYSSEGDVPAGDPPYVYKFNNGFEQSCPPDASPNPTCTVAASEVATLAPGEHTIWYSAVSESGQRFDNNIGDVKYPSPMPSKTLRYDPAPPIVELATVPAAPNRTHGGQGWFDTRPYVIGSAVDQFGASGVDTVEYSFNGIAGPWTPFDPADPPRADDGQTVACVRATDVAGNSAVDCQLLRVDSTAPSLTLTPDGSPAASGWYLSAPTFTVAGYNDGSGVGIDSDRFRWRVDNDPAFDCDPLCQIAPSNLPTGRHLVHASATDRFENRSGELTEEVLVDLEAPVVQPVLSPAEPDGNNGWYHRDVYLTVFAEDPGLSGANGVNRQGSGVGSISYSLTGLAGPFIPWTEPVSVGAGDHTLCWRASDVAGNTSATECQALRIDTDNPTTEQQAPAPGPSGWYDAPIIVTVETDDPLPGSGVNQAFDPDLSDLCNDLRPDHNPTTPSGTCVSVDGGRWVPYTGPITLGEGDHIVRSFAVDVSGRRGPVTERTYRIDLSPPVVVLRTLPPDPARAGWYRGRFESDPIRVVLRATDGRDGSGVTEFQYRVNGGGWLDYTEPFNLPEGQFNIETRAADLVGERTAVTSLKADTTSPFIHATQASRLVWSRLLGPSTIQLRFRLADNLSGPTNAWVVIYDVTGNPVRIIQHPTINLVPGAAPVERFVTWNGQQQTLTGLVPLGVYHYRVAVVDEAGNVAFSGESRPITIRLL